MYYILFSYIDFFKLYTSVFIVKIINKIRFKKKILLVIMEDETTCLVLVVYYKLCLLHYR